MLRFIYIFLDSNLPDDNELADTLGSSGNSKDTKDELSDILGPHFNLEYIPNINSKDVEDMFKVSDSVLWKFMKIRGLKIC